MLLQPTVKIEGPPPGLASGKVDVPRATIALAGAVVVLLGVVYLIARVARRRRP